MSTTFDFTGKVAVVTGGTKGIGYSIVRGFLDAGATVVTCGRHRLPRSEKKAPPSQTETACLTANGVDATTPGKSVNVASPPPQESSSATVTSFKDDLSALRHHPRLRFVVADVSTDAGREALFFAAASAGRASILVNNVGTNIRRRMHEFSPHDYHAVQARQIAHLLTRHSLTHSLTNERTQSLTAVNDSVCVTHPQY